MAERCVETTPPGGNRIAGREPERPLPNKPPGVLDRARGRVVTETLGDAAPISEQPEEPAPVAARVKDSLSGKSTSIVSSIAFQRNACSSCMASSAAAPCQ